MTDGTTSNGGNPGSSMLSHLARSILDSYIPGAAALSEPLLRAVAVERRRRVSVALRAAERASGFSREVLDAAIVHQPNMIPMLVKVLTVAGGNGHDRLLKMIGRALGRAVAEPTALRQQEVLLLAISDLTDDHIDLLVMISRKDGPRSPAALAEEVRGDVDLVRLLGAELARRALVQTPYGRFGGGEAYELSDLGRSVVHAAQLANELPD